MSIYDKRTRAKIRRANAKSLAEIKAVKVPQPKAAPKKLPGYYDRLEMKARGYAGDLTINRG